MKVFVAGAIGRSAGHWFVGWRPSYPSWRRGFADPAARG
jgi:hypothetical protein